MSIDLIPDVIKTVVGRLIAAVGQPVSVLRIEVLQASVIYEPREANLLGSICVVQRRCIIIRLIEIECVRSFLPLPRTFWIRDVRIRRANAVKPFTPDILEVRSSYSPQAPSIL